jgi:hypothetical protein
MKTMLKKLILVAVAALPLLFTSCDTNDVYLEDQIVGSWVAAYEDDLVFEEEVYEFDTAGRWSYRYYYQNINGEYIYEVDAGTYYVLYGQLKLRSNFSDVSYSYGMSISGGRLLLRVDGQYYEYQRYR